MTPAIQVVKLRARRGNFQLSIDDLQLEKGSVAGLVGDNGAGKTTLIEILAGIAEADEGTLRVMGYHPFREGAASLSEVIISWSREIFLFVQPLGLKCRET